MQTVSYQQSQTQVRVNAFVRSVYNWMAIGLALTGWMAYSIAGSPNILRFVFGNQLVFFGLIIGELAMVFYLSARINRIQSSTATALFLFYAALNGVTLSAIFIAFTYSSIASTFIICAATFLACSLYGWMTQRDLTSMGGFLTMGLIGIIIASVVNIFFKSPAMSAIISYIGVIVFVGLTAYDTQKLKDMALSQPADLEAGVIRKGAILGALSLYLDFINLFLMLLRIFGTSRE